MNMVKMVANILSIITVTWVLSCVNNPVGDGTSRIVGSNDPVNPETTTYTLTVSRSPTVGGTVTVNGSTTSGTTTHNNGVSVTVVAHPNQGYTFAGWSGASTSTNASITITMSGNRSLTANFQVIPVTHTLTVNRNPTAGGTVTVNGVTYTNPTTHNANASVTVVATASSGYVFTGWSGASTSTNNNITVTMGGDRTLTANFWSPPSTITYGSFTDSRNNRTYRTVSMLDDKVWMAENLNYRNPDWSLNDVSGDISWGGGRFGSWCYGNDSSNCNIYGRLYTWDAARVACPSGWRLPSRQEWSDLVNAVGCWSVAGTRLKAGSPIWNGDDTHGFSALPGGGRWLDGSFLDLGGWGFWWSATESDADGAWGVYMGTGYTNVDEHWGDKSPGLSVRCLRD